MSDPVTPRPSPIFGALSVALSVLATTLTIIGSVVPLFTVDVDTWVGKQSYSVTGWGSDLPFAVPVAGIPLAVAAVALLVSSIATRVACRSMAAVAERVAAVFSGVSAAFLVGVVGTIATQVAAWSDTSGLAALLDATMGVRSGPAVGFWLLVVAAPVAVLGALFAPRTPA